VPPTTLVGIWGSTAGLDTLVGVGSVHQLRDVLVDVEVLVVDEDDLDRPRREIDGEDRAVAGLAAGGADCAVQRGVGRQAGRVRRPVRMGPGAAILRAWAACR
jgi:hypothetical protein